jgi:hypothetical protein
MVNSKLTAQRVRELLHYDPDTGVFTWRINAGRWGRIKAGTPSGSPDADGYLRSQVDGTLYYCNRLAFLYMLGRWPNGVAEHRDGVPANNRWENLRDATQQVNTENRRRPIRNKRSGLPLGVSLDRRDGAIVASITVNGRWKYLGRFQDAETAHQAYLDAKRKLHRGCTV